MLLVEQITWYNMKVMGHDPHAPPSLGEQTEQSHEPYPLLGAYRLLSLLGEGGMGRVYLAKHEDNGRVVAVKVLRPEFSANHSAVRRFISEAQTVSRLGHPNIVRVEEVVEPARQGSPIFYVMEYLTGIDLRSELQRRYITLPRVVKIALQICEALEALHEAGVIHRDLKPANIFLIDREGQEDFVKLLDFGVAKLESSEGGLTTTTGHLMGTPAYMSPEQAAGERIDRRSDLYSVGVMLYEMITARRPFEASSFGGYVVQHLTVRPLRPSELSPPGAPIPEELDRIVLRCLEKVPPRRYSTARELASDLQQLLERRTTSKAPRRSSTRLLPGPLLSTLALSVLGGLVAVAIYSFMGASPPSSTVGKKNQRPPVVAPMSQRKTDRHRSTPAATGSQPEARRQITIRSAPVGAEVFVGPEAQEPEGTTPCTIAIPADTLTLLVLRHQGYQAAEKQVPPGPDTTLEVSLKPIDKVGQASLAKTRAKAGVTRGRSKVRPQSGAAALPEKRDPALDHVTINPF